MKNLRIFVLASVAILLYSFDGFAQEWKTYTIENSGLPGNNVLSIEIDNQGIFWFGTDKGLVQFDGESWNTYTTESDQNLSDNQINDVSFESNNGQYLLWMATENGVSTLDITNSELPVFAIPYSTDNSELIDNEVKSVTVDPGNVSWFGTFNGLSSLYQNSWGTYSTQNYWIEHDKVTSLESGPDSMVYIGTEGGGVSRLKMESVDAVSSASPLDKTWTGANQEDGGKLTSNNIHSILVEENGHQWFGTDDGIALHTSYNTKKDWKNYRKEDGLIDDFVQVICKESEGVFWFGTPNGVSRFDGNNWTNYTTQEGLVNNNVRDIIVDRDGSIWFATEGGISVLNNSTSIQTKQSLEKSNSLQIRNYPNPVVEHTSIIFTLNTNSNVRIDIFNISGLHIKTLANEIRTAGKQSFVWNRDNSKGNLVPAGVYFIQLIAGKQITTHKIIVNK